MWGRKVAKKPNKTKAKQYLKDRGHRHEDVDAEPFVDVVESVVKLHGGTMDGYRRHGL